MSTTVAETSATPASVSDIAPPMALLAELTHRCPLACPYCSNPLELVRKSKELDTATWLNVFDQAAELGVLHVHLSGGEPAARSDLEALTQGAAQAGLYTNLITSGVGLSEARLRALADGGLDHLQLSIQGTDPASADEIGGYRGGFAQKMRVAEWVAALDMPLTVNAVMHRRNLDRLEQTLDLAVRLGARRVEIATVQFNGWAVRNRDSLMPTRDQYEHANAIVAEARERLKGTLVIDYVPADHHATYPKPCMGGWGRIGMNVTPDGRVLPCHAAETIPGLIFDHVSDRPLADIWRNGEAFNAYRGDAWMQEPCRSCPRKQIDFGGCRCQAMAFTGDPAATDPVCSKSPHNQAQRALTEQAAAADAPLVYRRYDRPALATAPRDS
ncbi:MAG: pyrroloquinoline quinone biosynthesis protein PqqE [Geminicoccaceae bacterium]